MVSRRNALRTLAVTTSLGVAGCTRFNPLPDPNDDPPESVGTDWTPPEGTWALAAADPWNTRGSTLPAGAEPTVSWRARERPDTDRGPAVSIRAATPGTVYTSVSDLDTRGSTVRARAAADGHVRWRAPVDGIRGGGVVGDTFYATDGVRTVYALDTGDGTVRWRVDAFDRLAETIPERYLWPEPGDVFSPRLLPTPETVYLVTSYGHHGLDPADGTERWRVFVPPDDYPRSFHESDGGFVVTRNAVVSTHITESSQLTSLFGGEARTDDIAFGRLDISAPTFVDGILCATRGMIEETHGLDPVAAGFHVGSHLHQYADHEWTFPGLRGGDGVHQLVPAATDGGRLFLAQLTPADDRFRVGTVALDASDGTLWWLHETPVEGDASRDELDDFAVGTPAVAGDAVLVGLVSSVTSGEADPADGRLLALDAEDGSERWQVPVGVVPKEVAVAGDRIYVAGRRGGLVALDRKGTR